MDLSKRGKRSQPHNARPLCQAAASRRCGKFWPARHLTSSPPAFSQNAEAAAFSCQLPAAFNCQLHSAASRQLKKRKFVVYRKFSFLEKEKENKKRTEIFGKNFLPIFKERRNNTENQRGASSASNARKTVILLEKFILDYISLNVLSWLSENFTI